MNVGEFLFEGFEHLEYSEAIKKVWLALVDHRFDRAVIHRVVVYVANMATGMVPDNKEVFVDAVAVDVEETVDVDAVEDCAATGERVALLAEGLAGASHPILCVEWLGELDVPVVCAGVGGEFLAGVVEADTHEREVLQVAGRTACHDYVFGGHGVKARAFGEYFGGFGFLALADVWNVNRAGAELDVIEDALVGCETQAAVAVSCDVVYEALECFGVVYGFAVAPEFGFGADCGKGGGVENNVDSLSVDGVRSDRADGHFDVRGVGYRDVARFELRDAVIHLEALPPSGFERFAGGNSVLDLDVDPFFESFETISRYSKNLTGFMFFYESGQFLPPLLLLISR